MRMMFDDLFRLNSDGRSVSPKRSIRLGGMKLTEELVLEPGDSSVLGFDIEKWFGKAFDVSLDGDLLVITRLVLED